MFSKQPTGTNSLFTLNHIQEAAYRYKICIQEAAYRYKTMIMRDTKIRKSENIFKETFILVWSVDWGNTVKESNQLCLPFQN